MSPGLEGVFVVVFCCWEGVCPFGTEGGFVGFSTPKGGVGAEGFGGFPDPEFVRPIALIGAIEFVEFTGLIGPMESIAPIEFIGFIALIDPMESIAPIAPIEFIGFIGFNGPIESL